MKLQYRLLELFDAMLYSADFPEGFRAAIDLRGFNFGKSRQPLSAVQRIDKAALQHVLKCILADFGVVEPPPGGCALRTGDMTRDKISQIAQEVIEKLRQRGAV
jgi:4-hydroxy-tetrahydrodipicolinate synthase